MINITDKTKCTGCWACQNICPKKAISFLEDSEGYFYPSVDEDKCVNCSLCDKVCPILNEVDTTKSYESPKVYAAWNTDENIRINSTSGGVFSALAETFISEGGYVAGAEYTDDFSIVHTIISGTDKIAKQRQSKYAQSKIGNIFNEIKLLLDNGEKVMFCGTPCQTAGLRNFLRKDYDNMLFCDFICRGIINQKIYKDYLLSVEKTKNSKVSKIQFKNKDFGWNHFSTKISLDNGDTYHKDRYTDEYMIGYLKHNLFIRPSCHSCRFKKIPRVSDLTLGDFWGIGEKNPNLDADKGTSVVLVNTEKGNDFFCKAKEDRLIVTQCTLDDVTKGNQCLFNVAPAGKYRDYFFKRFTKIDFIKLIHQIDDKATKENMNLSLKERLYLLKKKIFK